MIEKKVTEHILSCGLYRSSDLYHLGLSNTGFWTWSNGDSVVYDKWLGGEPGSKSCGAAQNTGSHGWQGVDCDNDLHHILCEYQTSKIA